MDPEDPHLVSTWNTLNQSLEKNSFTIRVIKPGCFVPDAAVHLRPKLADMESMCNVVEEIAIRIA